MLDILKLQMITHQFHLYATNSVCFMAGTKYLPLFQKHTTGSVVHMNIKYITYNNGSEDIVPKCVSQNS